MKYKLIATYGIAAYSGNEYITAIPDISTSKSKTRKLCRLCNKLKLKPDQLRDIVDDSLCV